MKPLLSLLPALCITLALFHSPAPARGQALKPFELGRTPQATTVATAIAEARAALEGQGFVILGSYSPYPAAVILIVTNAEMKATAATSSYGAYGAVARIAVTESQGKLQLSYTNPSYFAAAYRLNNDLATTKAKLEAALGRVQDFGSEKGLPAAKLRTYHYAIGMERFDSLSKHLLAEFPSHSAALAAVEEGLAARRGGTAKVYRLDVPGKEEVLFGVALTEGKGADAYIMERIDFAELKSTAHLPYEILVSGNQVYHLFARFRIAIDFPDLSMMGRNSFMSIMSAPNAIKESLTAVVTPPGAKK